MKGRSRFPVFVAPLAKNFVQNCTRTSLSKLACFEEEKKKLHREILHNTRRFFQRNRNKYLKISLTQSKKGEKITKYDTRLSAAQIGDQSRNTAAGVRSMTSQIIVKLSRRRGEEGLQETANSQNNFDVELCILQKIVCQFFSVSPSNTRR